MSTFPISDFLKNMQEYEISRYGRVLNNEERDTISAEEEKKKSEAEHEKKVREETDLLMRECPARYRQATFATYNIETEEQKVAVDYLRSLSSALLLGGSGTGKTHLGWAVCREATSKGKSARIIPAYDFIDLVKRSFGNGSDDWRKLAYVDVLVLDELDKGYGTETEYLYIYRLINERYNSKLSTILISNAASAKEVETIIGKAAVDRIVSDGIVISAAWGNWRRKQ